VTFHEGSELGVSGFARCENLVFPVNATRSALGSIMHIWAFEALRIDKIAKTLNHASY
jgi:hypothetical protein